MHYVAFERFAMDRLKRAEAYAQREFANLYPPLANSLQNFRREVKTGRGSRNRSGTFGENGLVALAIRNFIRSLDVQRKRNMSEALEVAADAALVIRNKSQRAQA